MKALEQKAVDVQSEMQRLEVSGWERSCLDGLMMVWFGLVCYLFLSFFVCLIVCFCLSLFGCLFLCFFFCCGDIGGLVLLVMGVVSVVDLWRHFLLESFLNISED